MPLIRPRSEGDLDACVAVLQRVYDVNRYPVRGMENPKAFLTDPTHDQQAWVAEADDGQIVGHITVNTATPDDIACALWWETHPGDRIAILGRLFVDPARRGSGVAARLVQTAIDWGRRQGLRLVLFALAKDPAAGRLYRNLGWTNFGDSTFHWGEHQQMKAFCFVSPVTPSPDA